MYGRSEGENRYVFCNLLPKFAKRFFEGRNDDRFSQTANDVCPVIPPFVAALKSRVCAVSGCGNQAMNRTKGRQHPKTLGRGCVWYVLLTPLKGRARPRSTGYAAFAAVPHTGRSAGRECGLGTVSALAGEYILTL